MPSTGKRASEEEEGNDADTMFWRFFNAEERREKQMESRERATLLLTLGVAIPTRQVAGDWRC